MKGQDNSGHTDTNLAYLSLRFLTPLSQLLIRRTHIPLCTQAYKCFDEIRSGLQFAPYSCDILGGIVCREL